MNRMTCESRRLTILEAEVQLAYSREGTGCWANQNNWCQAGSRRSKTFLFNFNQRVYKLRVFLCARESNHHLYIIYHWGLFQVPGCQRVKHKVS